jgi:hypothetical protein
MAVVPSSGKDREAMERPKHPLNENNPMKGPTPRQGGGGTWWILVVILLVAAGLFWALGRSNRDATEVGPMGSSPSTEVAPADQVDNTLRTEPQFRDGGTGN